MKYGLYMICGAILVLSSSIMIQSGWSQANGWIMWWIGGVIGGIGMLMTLYAAQKIEGSE